MKSVQAKKKHRPQREEYRKSRSAITHTGLPGRNGEGILHERGLISLKELTDLPPQNRPRERLIEKGARALADYELVAILLGKGPHEHDVLSISRRLIKNF